jgi:hypothetical protein
VTQNRINIDPLSARSLLIELFANGHSLSTATGFIVEQGGTNYLVSNWHVLSGRNAETGKPMSPTAAVPDEIKIVCHHKGRLGSWLLKSERLINDDGTNRWREHPNGMQIDIAVLPLTMTIDDIDLYPLDLTLADVDMIPEPAMPVSIIGYPFGLSAGGAWPIWKTGHIATDPDINYDGRPAFLIDATTRGGMSGSPVVLRMNGGFRTNSGNQILAGGITTKFLGIYSGRIHADAELGRVWRPFLINEVIANV